MEVDGHAKVTASLAAEPSEDADKSAKMHMEAPMDHHTGEPSSPYSLSAALRNPQGVLRMFGGEAINAGGAVYLPHEGHPIDALGIECKAMLCLIDSVPITVCHGCS